MPAPQSEPTGRSARRDRIALATWSSSTKGRISAQFTLDRDDLRTAHPGVATVAAVGWAVASGLAAHPDVNRRVVMSAVRRNPTVRVSFAVNLGHDLQAVVIDRADELTPGELQRALVSGARAVHHGAGPFSTATRLLGALPVTIGRPALAVSSVLSAGWGIPLFGVRAAPFGGALISSVASLGLHAVDPPFVPFTRCALVISVGAERWAAVVRDGDVVARNVLDLSVTADHRVCDGAQFASFAQHVLGVLG